MADSKRGAVLTTFAVLFGLIAVSNMLKPFQFGGARTGFVFFGTRLSGLPNTVIGPLFGVFQAVYAAGIWRMRRYAIPMSHAYALYVLVNLFLFNELNSVPEGAGYKIIGLIYVAVAVGVSLGSAIILTKRKSELS